MRVILLLAFLPTAQVHEHSGNKVKQVRTWTVQWYSSGGASVHPT